MAFDNRNKKLLDQLIASANQEAVIEKVAFGLHWTAAKCDGKCGLCSSLYSCRDPKDQMEPPPDNPEGKRSEDVLPLLYSTRPRERSLAMAVLNSLLPPPDPEKIIQANALDIIAEKVSGKTAAIIGHFPGMDKVREKAKEFHVLELRPLPGDLPADEAPEILPQCDVLGLSSTTLLNGTFCKLVELLRPECYTVLVGPSTPLSPILFSYGVNLLSGSIVTNPNEAIEAVEAGASFREVKQYARLVNVNG